MSAVTATEARARRRARRLVVASFVVAAVLAVAWWARRPGARIDKTITTGAPHGQDTARDAAARSTGARR